MLLRSKAHLINSNILHLTYTLVGTVNSEHENSCIPSPIAFRDLLAGAVCDYTVCVHVFPVSSLTSITEVVSVCNLQNTSQGN